MTAAADAATVAGLDLRSMSDEALAAMFGDGEQPLSPAAMAEMTRRRDRAQTRRRKAAQARAAAEAEWMDAAHAHFLAAEAACAGNLTAPGSRIGEPFPGLYRISDLDFYGTQDMHGSAGRPGQASEEMREFCRSNPRPVRSDFIKRAFAPRKGTGHGYPWRDDPTWTEAGTVSTGAGGLAEFAPPATPAAQEPRAQASAGEDLGAGNDADPGAVQRAAARAERAARLADMRAQRGAGTRPVCRHPGRVDLCADCPRRAGTALAVPAPGRVITPGPASVIAHARAVPDAQELLGQVLEGTGLYLSRHVQFSSRAQVVAAAGWIGQAAGRDGSGAPWPLAYPRLLPTSRDNGSGKSTLADMARILLQCRAGRPSKITPYGVCKVLGKLHEPAIVDDAQNVFVSGRAARELLNVLINGYTPGATWVSGQADGRIEACDGPAIIVGKDALITRLAEYTGDLIARSIVLRLDRPSIYMPQLDWEARAHGEALGRALVAVTSALVPNLRAAEVELAREMVGQPITEGDGGRIAQIWRPLRALARVAAGRWPDAMDQAMSEIGTAGYGLLNAADEITRLIPDGVSFWED